jgi:hypothetical protein
MEWEVQVIKNDDDYEVSVIKKYNIIGHETWGYGGADKIILWPYDCTNSFEMNVSDIDFMLDVANKLCKLMNDE